MQRKKIVVGLPFVILFLLLAVLWQQLFYGKPNEIPSNLIGQSVPPFRLNNLVGTHTFVSNEDLKGKVSLLNIWATWCSACAREHTMLLNIANHYHIPIIGIAYKDQAEKVISVLQESGNPFQLVGNDKDGNVGIDLGVYGTPETFIINKNGEIVFRHVGPIDQKTWLTILYPVIKKYEG